MNDDLISRKAFMEYLGLEDTEENREENVGEIVTLEDFDRQPTAFDKEKVIEQIKVLSAGIILNTNICDDYAEGYVRAAKDIIEIVKKGGIE